MTNQRPTRATQSLLALVVVGMTAPAAGLENRAPAVVHLAPLVRHRVCDSVEGVAQLRLRHGKPQPAGEREPSLEPLLAALGDGEVLEATMELPLERLKGLQPDAVLRLYDSDGAKVTESPLSRVVPDFDGRSGAVRLESVVDNSARRLRPGSAVRARLILHFDKAITVPAQAVLRIGGRSFVMVAEGRGDRLVARRRLVHLGSLVDGGYVVRDGVAAGERVVSCSPYRLDDGAALLAP
jgi:multidrug efflux pump subunit AcrA (membrane-fusion protein)